MTTTHHPDCEIDHQPTTGCARLIQRPPTGCEPGAERTWTFATVNVPVRLGAMYVDPVPATLPRIVHATAPGPRGAEPWPVIQPDTLRETTTDAALYQEALAEINRLRALLADKDSA